MRGPEQGHRRLGASPATIKPSPCLAPAGLRWKITVSHSVNTKAQVVSREERTELWPPSPRSPTNPILEKQCFQWELGVGCGLAL